MWFFLYQNFNFMRIINNKFKTKCAATLRVIMPGESILLDGKKAYSIHSKEYKAYQDYQMEAISTKQFIQAQEDAYFDKFCRLNNI
jgi:hypothetical protein